MTTELDEFLARNDFVDLYKYYNWRNDNYNDGFPDILNIENTLIASDRNEGISLRDVRTVADWGKLRNPARIEGSEIVLPPRTLHGTNNIPSESLAHSPLAPVLLLERNIEKGIGPTYLSKVLRFGLPTEYGAIDTRCVRVFGEGDPRTQRHHWLNLRTRNDGYGWYISKAQRAWPSDYDIWLNILRYFSQKLLSTCPHPEAFVHCGLRSNNKWACADIEMAIFAYASQFTT
ncbi:MAG: hypothetical protein ABSG48_11245 [Geobacteraceae bacterium]